MKANLEKSRWRSHESSDFVNKLYPIVKAFKSIKQWLSKYFLFIFFNGIPYLSKYQSGKALKLFSIAEQNDGFKFQSKESFSSRCAKRYWFADGIAACSLSFLFASVYKIPSRFYWCSYKNNQTGGFKRADKLSLVWPQSKSGFRCNVHNIRPNLYSRQQSRSNYLRYSIRGWWKNVAS